MLDEIKMMRQARKRDGKTCFKTEEPAESREKQERRRVVKS